MAADPRPRHEPDQVLSRRWLVLAAGMFAQASVSMLQQGLPVLGPLLRDHYALSLSALGAVLACASWGAMMTVFLWGKLADRFGERGVSALGLGTASVALVAAGSAGTPLLLGAAILVAGAMSASVISASGRAIMVWFPRSERGLALGLRQMAVTIGAAASAVALPLVAAFLGLDGVFQFLALVSLAAAVIAWAVLRRPADAGEARGPGNTSSVSPVRDASIWRLSTGCSLIQWTQVALNSFLVIILIEVHGFGYAAAAAVFAGVQVVSGGMRVLAGWASDRAGHRLPHLVGYALGLVAAILTSATFMFFGQPLAAGFLILATVLSFSWNGLAFAAVSEFAGPSAAGAALGLHATLMRVLTIPAALSFGWSSAHLGWWPSLALLALLPSIGLALLRPLAAEEKRRTGS